MTHSAEKIRVMLRTLRQCISKSLRSGLISALLFFSPALFASEELCIEGLKDYFKSSDSFELRKQVLELQGQITLNRLAWAHLKNSENQAGLETIQDSILALLEAKAKSGDEKFRDAVENFEAAPLTRQAMADVAPFIADLLKEKFSGSSEMFRLNSSDAKLLSILAQHEKGKANFSSNKNSSSSILNFASLINSSYRDRTRSKMFFSSNLSSLEAEINKLSEKLAKEINSIPRPSACDDESISKTNSCADSNVLWNSFLKDHALKALLDTAGSILASDHTLYDGLKYGDFWLKVKSGTESVPIKTINTKTEVNENVVSKKPVASQVITPEYFKDPIHVIVQDKPGRKNESFKTFDKQFLQEWAKAVFDNKKTFVIGDKLYDRASGKSLNPALVYQEILNKEPNNFSFLKKSPWPKDSTELAFKVNALKNGESGYIYKGKLYNTLFGAQDPVSVIVDYKKKNGVKATASQYKSFDQSYLSSRALAILNDKKTFYVDGKEYATDTGFGLTSPNRDIASAGYEENYKIEQTDRKNSAKLSDLDVIVKYQKEHAQKMTCPYYSVVDKKAAKLDVYSNAGVLQKSFEVLLGKTVSDKKTQWLDKTNKVTNTVTGAGAYEIRDYSKEHSNVSNGYYKNVYNNKLLNLFDTNGNDQVMAIHQVPNDHPERMKYFDDGNASNNRVSGGCVNVKPSEFDDFYKFMTSGTGCKVFVLPEEPGNRFVEKNDQLNFTTDNDLKPGEVSDYNFNSTKKYLPIKIKIDNEDGNTFLSRSFVKALQDEKESMMKAYGLDNDDYNDLAMIAYGIMGQESKFGKISSKVWIKEMPEVQDAIWAKKCAERLWNLKDCSGINNSRGFTQIKTLPESVRKYDPSISLDSLVNGRNSAVATMGFLADTFRQIKLVEEENRKTGKGAKISRETRMDYMIYLYMGSAGKLKKNGSEGATPESNIYIQNVKKYIGYLDIKEKMNYSN